MHTDEENKRKRRLRLLRGKTGFMSPSARLIILVRKSGVKGLGGKTCCRVCISLIARYVNQDTIKQQNERLNSCFSGSL